MNLSKTSGVSLHFEKHKANASHINGLQRHNERRPGDGYHSNKHIEPEKTGSNVFLLEAGETYKKRVENIISRQREGGLKGVRKDAVRMVEATVQLSGRILDCPDSVQEAMLRDAFTWLKDKFGADNVVSAVIHKDETNMHLHFDFVPMVMPKEEKEEDKNEEEKKDEREKKDKKGKLNAKVLLSKWNLQAYQSDFLAFLQKKYATMNFVRQLDGTYNGLPQGVFEKFQEERERLFTELDERKKELNKREEDLEDRKKTLEDRKKDLDSCEETLKTREMVLDIREKMLEARKGNLSIREWELDQKEKNLLKTQNKALEAIEELNKLVGKGIRLTERQRKQVNTVLKNFNPVTEENLQDLTTALEQLKNDNGLNL